MMTRPTSNTDEVDVDHSTHDPEAHDRTIEPGDTEQTAGDDGLTVCPDCRAPSFYCYIVEDWCHVDEAAALAAGCFLETDRARAAYERRMVERSERECGVAIDLGPRHDPYGTSCERQRGHTGDHLGPDPFGERGDWLSWSGGGSIVGDAVPFTDLHRYGWSGAPAAAAFATIEADLTYRAALSTLKRAVQVAMTACPSSDVDLIETVMNLVEDVIERPGSFQANL